MLNKILLIFSLILMISCNTEKDTNVYEQNYFDSIITSLNENNNKGSNNKKRYTSDTQNVKYTPKSLSEIANEAYEESQKRSQLKSEKFVKEYVRDIYKKGDEIYIKGSNEAGVSDFINKYLEFKNNYGRFYISSDFPYITRNDGKKYYGIMLGIESDILDPNTDCNILFKLEHDATIDYTGDFLDETEISWFSAFKINSIYIYRKDNNEVLMSAENINSDYFIKCFKAVKNNDIRIEN